MELIFFFFLTNYSGFQQIGWGPPTLERAFCSTVLFFFYYSCRNSLHEFWGTRDRMLWTKCFCPPRKPLCWSPNSQYNGMWRWGLDGAIKFRVEIMRVGLLWGVGVSLRRERDHQSPSLHMMVQQEGARRQGRKRALSENWVFWHLDLGLSSLHNCEE